MDAGESETEELERDRADCLNIQRLVQRAEKQTERSVSFIPSDGQLRGAALIKAGL